MNCNGYVIGEIYDGMICEGMRSHKGVNNGELLHGFRMLPETAESWNAKCRAQFLRYYVQDHGHEPENFGAEYAEHVRRAYIACGRQDLLAAINKI